jgi:hypothetical protein
MDTDNYKQQAKVYFDEIFPDGLLGKLNDYIVEDDENLAYFEGWAGIIETFAVDHLIIGNIDKLNDLNTLRQYLATNFDSNTYAPASEEVALEERTLGMSLDKLANQPEALIAINGIRNELLDSYFHKIFEYINGPIL